MLSGKCRLAVFGKKKVLAGFLARFFTFNTGAGAMPAMHAKNAFFIQPVVLTVIFTILTSLIFHTDYAFLRE